MKYILLILCVSFWSVVMSQTKQTTDQIRQQMAKIRQTTNWDDPAAAQKANEQIKELAKQLNGGRSTFNFNNSTQQQSGNNKPVNFTVGTTVSKENIVLIADRFYRRSYKALDAVSRNQFDIDFKEAEKEKFNLEAVRKLATSGAAYINFHGDDNLACVYTTSAVKAFPLDTLSVNNFGAYLRLIDSTAISVPVLLYANKLFSQSPIILTQLGNSYFELNDFTKAETYYKQALKISPDFGQAHTSLCDLYIKQNRLQDAILELFAGVKGMGCSYRHASSNFSYLQSQAENSANGASDKEKFWDETKKQTKPEDALAPLVPDDNHLKMPNFPDCQRVEDWEEGGGWSGAVQAYNTFHGNFMSFASDFLNVHKQIPSIPAGAVLRDYPNERFALDCITEMFMNQAALDEKKYHQAVEKITQKVNDAKELYINNLLTETKKFTACCENCGKTGSCIEKCHWEFCQEECPNANKFNDILRRSFLDWFTEFKKLENNQKKFLDDLYGFSDPWFKKIESPYWSKIYAYEIRRVALSIIGNCYGSYPQFFQSLSHNSCGADCSIYANPFPTPPEEVKEKAPEGNQCPNIGKIKITFDKCDLALDCESIEFGCAAGVAASIKRNFVKKTTTGFLGVGVKGGAGFIGAGFRAGLEVTVTDNNEVEDVGAKFDASVSLGSGVTKAGASATGSYTVMTGLKSKVGFSAGGKAQ